jgi:hypothetical protein
LCFGIGLLMSKSPARFIQDLPTIVGKLLEKQDGGALREGIRGLSEALMETGSVTATRRTD